MTFRIDQLQKSKLGNGRIRSEQAAGFTLVEVLVAAGLFVIISLSVYHAYVAVIRVTELSQSKIVATNLANEWFEISRNIPYSDLGVKGGIVPGNLPQNVAVTRGGITFDVTITVRNIDRAFDGTVDSEPPDTMPADNKLVEVIVSCDSCQHFDEQTLSSVIAPEA
jgi:prepilin-type N-terminal cleavage/methylation domain-containing protein